MIKLSDAELVTLKHLMPEMSSYGEFTVYGTLLYCIDKFPKVFKIGLLNLEIDGQGIGVSTPDNISYYLQEEGYAVLKFIKYNTSLEVLKLTDKGRGLKFSLMYGSKFKKNNWFQRVVKAVFNIH